jgi:hypothetical protein
MLATGIYGCLGAFNGQGAVGMMEMRDEESWCYVM